MMNDCTRCRCCPNTDGLVYTSNPPKVRCKITGEFHYFDDECDVSSDLEKNKNLKNSNTDNSNISSDNLTTPCINLETDATTATASIDITNNSTRLATSCIICGESIELNDNEKLSLQYGLSIHSKVCEKCKEAVLYIREQILKK